MVRLCHKTQYSTYPFYKPTHSSRAAPGSRTRARHNFPKGDVLLTRTGWTDAYYKLSEEEKDKLGGRDERVSIGVEATEQSVRWHWEQEFAAVASDTVAYEAWPSPKRWGVCMHEVGITFIV